MILYKFSRICDVWAVAPNYNLDILDNLQKRICRVIGTALQLLSLVILTMVTLTVFIIGKLETLCFITNF